MFHCGLLQQLCTILMATGVPADILTEVRGAVVEGGREQVGATSRLQGSAAAAGTDSRFAKHLFHRPEVSASSVGSLNGRVIYLGEFLEFCNQKGFAFA